MSISSKKRSNKERYTPKLDRPSLQETASLGKKRPYDLELEKVVLGALMLEKDALSEVIEILKVETFDSDKHKRIYNAIITLFTKSEPIDMMTVTNQLRFTAELEIIGGAYAIAELTQRVNSAANIIYHSRILVQYAIKRELISIANDVQKGAYEETTDVFELLDQMEQSLFEVSEMNIRKNYSSMSSIMAETFEELENMKDKPDGLTGIPSGFSDLDRVTSGFQRSDLIIIAARPGMGKCLGKGTNVLMFDGSLKQVENVKKGDLLMGDDSTPRKVLSIARGREKMYYIRQNQGIDYRVNGSHILSLKRSRNENPYTKKEVLNISVKDYLEKPQKYKSNYKGYKVAVEFPEKQLDIEPYFLGVYLGDRYSYSSKITTKDKEVITYLNSYAEKPDLRLVEYVQREKCTNYTITKENCFSIQAELSDLNLLDNKHIPQQYLINSTYHRLQLLAGLIDSGGYYDKQANGYEITFKNKYLISQLKFLCDSLGFRTSFKEKEAVLKERNYKSIVYCLHIFGDINKIPVKVEQKKTDPRKSIIDWTVTGISIQYDKIDDYYGFEIDGNRLFLLEDMTVTHNTAFVISAMRNAAVQFGKGVAIFSLEMSSVQLVKRLISAEAKLSSEKLKTGQLTPQEWDQLVTETSKLQNAPIFIDDTPALSILELRAKCRRLKAQNDISMIIIDYLQLMSGGDGKSGGNREQEIAMISRSLKQLAKELNVPVLALSQLSRAVETRGGDKKPQLSDLRESGCLAGDTIIQNNHNGELFTIKELAERSVQNTISCLALEKNMKVKPNQMVKVFYSGKKMVFELTTRSGRKIEASANHPFYKVEGWTRLDELQLDNKIALPKSITIQKPTNPINKDELILLAHLIGDGCILPKQPYHYTSVDSKNLQIVSEKAFKLFGIKSREVSQKPYVHTYLPSPIPVTHGKKHPITIWYENLKIERVPSYDKKLPKDVFSCDKEYIALFLTHLWATDGNISWKKWKDGKDSVAVYYSSTSKKLIEQVQYLLLYYGVQSIIRTSQKAEYRICYLLYIEGTENQLLFLKNIGCFGKRGEIIPDLVQALENINTFLPYNSFKNLADSDVLWDEVISIEEKGMKDVYDATVEKEHNFLANSIIVHNSIEQDADIVMFLYRPEYYGITEDEEGNTTVNMGEVIIAKHRNGSLKNVRLKFMKEFTYFTDYETDHLNENVGFDEFDVSQGGTASETMTLPSKMNMGNDKPLDNNSPFHNIANLQKPPF